MILLKLFTTFFKIGAFTFGGGYAMIPLIKAEVLKYGWASVADIINFIGISESTPGPFAINLSTFVGFNTAGVLGALSASIGVVLPSFVIILIISKFFLKFQDNKQVRAVLYGLRPAVVGTIASSAVVIFISVFFKKSELINPKGLIILAIVGTLYFTRKKLHPIWLIVISGILGLILYL